jgi:choline dehydrogenase
MNFADPSNVSEKELEQYIYDNLQTLYHPCCTVAMGSVLDDQFKVKGVEGLRVIDASAMPEIPRANTNVPTVMIAEIASTFIANDHDFKL